MSQVKILPISSKALDALVEEAMSFEPLFKKSGLVFPLIRTGNNRIRLRPDVGRGEMEPLFNLLNQGAVLSAMDYEKVGLSGYVKESLTLPARWTYPQARIDCKANENFASPWHRDQWILGDDVKGLIVWFSITEDGGRLAITQKQDFSVVPNSYWGLEAQFRDESEVQSEEVQVEFGKALVFDGTLIHKSMPLSVGQISVQLRYQDISDVAGVDYTPPVTQKHSPKIKSYQAHLAGAK